MILSQKEPQYLKNNNVTQKPLLNIGVWFYETGTVYRNVSVDVPTVKVIVQLHFFFQMFHAGTVIKVVGEPSNTKMLYLK